MERGSRSDSAAIKHCRKSPGPRQILTDTHRIGNVEPECQINEKIFGLRRKLVKLRLGSSGPGPTEENASRETREETTQKPGAGRSWGPGSNESVFEDWLLFVMAKTERAANTALVQGLYLGRPGFEKARR